MANITTFLQNSLLGHSLGITTYVKPTTIYAALYTVAPSTNGGGTELNPATATGYARIPVTWGAVANGAVANSADIRFPSVGGAGSTWGVIVAVGLFDTLAAATGNLLWFGNTTSSITINPGDDFRVASGGLTVRLS